MDASQSQPPTTTPLSNSQSTTHSTTRPPGSDKLVVKRQRTHTADHTSSYPPSAEYMQSISPLNFPPADPSLLPLAPPSAFDLSSLGLNEDLSHIPCPMRSGKEIDYGTSVFHNRPELNNPMRRDERHHAAADKVQHVTVAPGGPGGLPPLIQEICLTKRQ